MTTTTKQMISNAFLALTMLVLSACAEKKLEETEIIISEFKLLDKKFFNNHGDPKKLTISHDGKHVYLTVNNDKELFHGDADKISEESGWTSVKLATGLDGTAGKAKLEKANYVIRISAAKDGALISVDGPAPVPPDTQISKGAFYLQGAKSYQAAWAATAQDLNAVPVTALLADRIQVDRAVHGILVSDKNNNDVPYFFAEDSNAPGDYIAMTKADLKPSIANLLLKRNTNFAVIPHFVSGGDYLFAVTGAGVTTIAKDDIAKAKTFADVAGPAAATTDGLIGGESFKFDEDKVVAHRNNLVNAVIVANDKLFIGLGSGANHEGGVAVYEIKPKGTVPSVKRPHIKWNGIAVNSLIKDNKGVVWAVTADNILEAKPNGEKGDSFIDGKEAADKNFASAKSGFKKESFPRTGINGAVFAGDQLLIATDKGLMVISESKKTLVGSKLVKVE